MHSVNVTRNRGLGGRLTFFFVWLRCSGSSPKLIFRFLFGFYTPGSYAARFRRQAVAPANL